MSIGQKIRDRRKELGMTQKQLGELCGMADSAIRKYESGKITPKYVTLKKIACALQLPIHALSYVYFETDTDGSSVAEINLNQIKEDSRKMLTLLPNFPEERIGIMLKDDSEKQALEYFLEHSKTSPQWIDRLVNAFCNLDFASQQILISFAEDLISERDFQIELEKLTALMPRDAEE